MIRPIKPRRWAAKELAGTVWGELMELAPGEARLEPRRTHLQDIVTAERGNLAASASLDETVEGDFKVKALTLDIPVDVDAELYIDDVLRFKSRDRLGLGGGFTLGDPEGDSYMEIRKVRVVATNQHATNPRNVRAWMVLTR